METKLVEQAERLASKFAFEARELRETAAPGLSVQRHTRLARKAMARANRRWTQWFWTPKPA